jgi:hypothetical protein
MFKSCSNNGLEWERKILILIFRLDLVAHAGWVIKNTIYHKNRKWVNIFLSSLTTAVFFFTINFFSFLYCHSLNKNFWINLFPYKWNSLVRESFYSYIFFRLVLLVFNNFIYWSIFYSPKYIFEFFFKVFRFSVNDFVALI